MIARSVPSSLTPVICQANFSPSVTELSSPSQMMPSLPVSRPLWKSVTTTLLGAAPPATWQAAEQFVVSSIARWTSPNPTPASKPKPSIDSWQVKQFAPLTVIEFAAASLSVSSWQTLQLFMYVGYVTEKMFSSSYS